MRLEKYILKLNAESKEGIAGLVVMLEEIVENMKGGFEVGSHSSENNDYSWAIDTEWK